MPHFCKVVITEEQRYFSFEKGCGTQRVTQNLVGDWVLLVIPMPGNEGYGMLFRLASF
jgi:hypothetical protein